MKEKQLINKYEDKIYDIDCKYQKVINELEKENTFLRKVVDRFKTTVKTFIYWVCNKFSVSSEEQLMRDFEKETRMNFDVEEAVQVEQLEIKENDLDLEF